MPHRPSNVPITSPAHECARDIQSVPSASSNVEIVDLPVGFEEASTSSKRRKTNDNKKSHGFTKRAKYPIEQVSEEYQCDIFKRSNRNHVSEPTQPSNPIGENRSAVILSGKLPAVLRWARKFLDDNLNAKNSSSAKGIAKQKRNIFSELLVPRNVLVDLESSRKLWTGDARFWTNVFSFASKLPPNDQVLNIIDAMDRYPSSVLVNTGLQQLLGTVRRQNKKKVSVAFPRPNVFSVFDNFSASGHPTSMWFESETYGRLQEIVIHVTSVAEYVLCCATQARVTHTSVHEAHTAFLECVVKDVQICEGGNSLGLITLSTHVTVENMPLEVASRCLQTAIQVAHVAVLKGLAKAGRKYGLKRRKETPRQKVQLWMMRRVFPEVMDVTVAELKKAIFRIMGVTEEEAGIETDMLELYLKRILRAMDKLYVAIGDIHFGERFKMRSTAEMDKGTQLLLSPVPYKYARLE